MYVCDAFANLNVSSLQHFQKSVVRPSKLLFSSTMFIRNPKLVYRYTFQSQTDAIIRLPARTSTRRQLRRMMEYAGSRRWRLSSLNCSSVALKSLIWIPSLGSVSHSQSERLRVRLRLSIGVNEIPQSTYYSILFYSILFIIKSFYHCILFILLFIVNCSHKC